MGSVMPLATDWLVWHAVRFRRLWQVNYGWHGLLILVLFIAFMAFYGIQRYQMYKLAEINKQTTLSNANDKIKQGLQADALSYEAVDSPDEARKRLAHFDKILLARNDTPVAVQGILTIAERNGLQTVHGEYNPAVVSTGGFLRYQMILPVKGNAVEINRFIDQALVSIPALALESVQFKRSNMDIAELEASIHWVLLIRIESHSTRLTGSMH